VRGRSEWIDFFGWVDEAHWVGGAVWAVRDLVGQKSSWLWRLWETGKEASAWWPVALHCVAFV